MRLTELALENYGSCSTRELVIPKTAGLTVVFGANEAGKSTCLEAISDFLFSIPKNTQRGSLFGYDGMRISASMLLADGTSLVLRRRKGNGRTLADSTGTAFDDTVLAPVLGAITRDRFETLFGLNHETLRNGGERLLQAEGDIGRLIVEAGGGLRALVSRIESIDAEADKLFDTRRSASRAFYQQLTAFEAAEKTARGAQLSRETYGQTHKAAVVAAEKLNALRDERRSLSSSTSRLERISRVAPHLRQLAGFAEALAEYDDMAHFPADFASRVKSALEKRDLAARQLEAAVERRDRVKARLATLVVSQPLKSLEKRIRDLGERAIYVGKARSDRANRQREIDEGELQLAALRRMLGLSVDADLSSLLPDQASLDRVRNLAEEALERRPSLVNAQSRAKELAERLHTLDVRLESARLSGFDAPPEASSLAFASLAAQKSALSTRQQVHDSDNEDLKRRLTSLGFNAAQELTAFACPAAEDVRAEHAAREALVSELEEQAKLKRQAQRDITTAEADIAELQASGTIASDVSLAEARGLRTETWDPIRSGYGAGQLPDNADDRHRAVDAFEAALSSADELADRRAAEAQRAASLAQAVRRVADATARSLAAQEEETALSRQIESRDAAWSQGLPAAHGRHPDLGALLLFAQQREQLLVIAESLRIQSHALAVDAAQLVPTVELLERIEQSRGLDASLSFAARVSAMQEAIAQHEQGHADLLRDLRDREDVLRQHKAADDKLRQLRAAQADWDAAWPTATKALGLRGDVSPADASNTVTEWAGARGVLSAIGQARHRLQRMDEDEVSLGTDAGAVATELGFDVSDDCIVAAQMLLARFETNATVQTQYDGLLPDYEEAKVEAGFAQDAVDAAKGDLAILPELVKIEPTDEALLTSAMRCEARTALCDEIIQVERTATDIGDQLGLSTLRSEWGGRDLDDIRAELDEQKARASEIDYEVEAAILAEKAAQDELAAFMDESQVNHAVAERESATAQMHLSLERYLELSVARELVTSAMATMRAEQQDPLIKRAGELFTAATLGEFNGIETDIDDKGQPIVVGRRTNGGMAPVATMSDGTRDQLFLAFRMASLESYAGATEPLPFIADDILVHFDDDRSRATLGLLGEFGRINQVLLFTHHRSVRALAEPLVANGLANIIDLDRAETHFR